MPRLVRIAICLVTGLLTSTSFAQQLKSDVGIDTVVNCSNAKNNYIALFTAAAPPNITICNSLIFQSSGNIGIGTTSPVASLDVSGNINATTNYEIAGSTVLSIGTPGNDNVFVGPGAGISNSNGNSDTFVGDMAGYSNNSGVENVFVGTLAGANNASGYDNNFFGFGAGQRNTMGDNNTFAGFGAGASNTTGSRNIFVGTIAGSYNTSGSGDIYVDNTGPSPGTENATIRIGTEQNTTYIAGIYGAIAAGGLPVYINSNGQLGTSASSLRFKEQVRDMGDSTNALMKLRPVTFLYKPEYANGDRTPQYGLIAEEVARVYPDLVAYDNDGRPYSVRYQYLTSMLLNEAQKQYRRVESQAKVIAAQEQKIHDLEQRLSRLEKLAGSELRTVAQK